MSTRYRITPEGRGPEPRDEDILRYRDSGRLLYNYQRAKVHLHRRPLYKDPKAFATLLIIVLLAVLITDVIDKEQQPAPPAPPDTVRTAPAPTER
jgi:hypothetical protein